MALTHALSTNNYGSAHLIVATSAANGTHTTLAAAMADAVSGDTIFLRDSVTENVTLTAGVNIAAWTGGTLNTPTITGTLTMTTAGTCNISGIRLTTNSAAILAVTGSAASIVNLNNCYLNCSNNTGITFSTSSSSARVNIYQCQGDIGTTGIGLFAHSSAGTMNIANTTITNSGNSTTANVISAGSLSIQWSAIYFPISVTTTGALSGIYTYFDTSATNTTCIAIAVNSGLDSCMLKSGTATPLTVSAGTIYSYNLMFDSSNATAVSGAGTIVYSPITPQATNALGTISASTSTPAKISNIYTSGLTFDGTNIMAYYVEGTFTPTVTNTSANMTGISYSTQYGRYTRIGNIVFCNLTVVWTNSGAGTGNLLVDGLPFTIKNESNYFGRGVCQVQNITYPASVTYVVTALQLNTTTIGFSGVKSAAAEASIPTAAFTNGVIATDFFYFI